MMRKLSDHIIYRDARFFCAFPAAVLVADEELLVVFRRARDPRYLFSTGETPDKAWFESVDHLDSRSLLTALRLGPDLRLREGPVDLPVDPEAADQDPSLLRLRDGRMPQLLVFLNTDWGVGGVNRGWPKLKEVLHRMKLGHRWDEAWLSLPSPYSSFSATIWRKAPRSKKDGTIDHLVITFLVDETGRIAERYVGLDHHADDILEDVVRVAS